MPAVAASTNLKKETVAEMAASPSIEGEKIDVVPNTKEGKQNVLSDADLDVLLDRRPEVFSERRKGWISGESGAWTEMYSTFKLTMRPLAQGKRRLSLSTKR